MSKFTMVVFIFLACLCFTILAFAQNNSNVNVPEGMEVVTIGGSGQLIVPKGAKTKKVGSQLFVEGTKEFMSRKFEEMEERFAKIEATQEDMKKQLETLQTKINSAPQPQNQAQPPQVIEKSGSMLIK